MEATAQRDVDLHKKVGDDLNTIGFPANTVPASEQPVLSKGIELPDIVPEKVEELVFGRDSETFVRGTEGENWRQRLKKRILGKWK